ncbi:DsbA family oxidoreductase [Jatrophihabitans telluris]|uniref:DsbA family oxidoreductase n=1 Tax=Jatrophihabitans telluris TaxID=2038343 RepID=A0ABY4R0Y3_9ACTN|nr:DsbA family oxidoreductase [Jatrophihabitans telluris]UQX89137.1 DsbA family oxidoreductase [Jatrophihabitans telluris]
MKLEIFSDVACPWCYIGKTKLEPALDAYAAAHPEEQVELRYRPFLLQPDMTGPSRPELEYLTEKFGPQAAAMTDSVSRAGAEVGLDLNFDTAIAASTRPAHQLIEAAWVSGGYPAQRRAADELFASHFARGEDIADPGVLGAVADRAGLPSHVLEQALSEPAVAAAVEDSLVEAAQLGIQAVPTFVVDRRIAVQGAQPTHTLLALLEKGAEQPAGS